MSRPSPARARYLTPRHSSPLDGVVLEPSALAPLNCVYRDDPHGIFLYQGDCLEVLDAIAAKYPDGCFDMMLPLKDKRRLV